MLGDYGGLSCGTAQRGQGGSQYGDECAGVFIQCFAECGIYFWVVWSAQAGGDGSGGSDFFISYD